MRKFTLIVTVIVLLANAGWVAQAHAQWPSATTKDPRFTVEIGGKAYDRPGSELNLPLITEGATGATLFGSNDASDLGVAGGAEVKFSWVNKNNRELEFRSILAFWEQMHVIEGTDLSSPFFPAPGPPPTTVEYGYESDFFSFELMSRRAVAPGVTLMFGPRIVSTRDQISLAGSLMVDPGDGGPIVDFTETRITEATNTLLGFQGGLEFNVPVSQSIYINSFIRVGGYTNPTQVTTSTRDNFTPGVVSTRETKSTGSFLGEIGGRLYVDIVPNSFSTYIGYEAIWIDGIALAPAQLLTTGATGVQTANTPFFNAAVFGLQWGY